MPDAMHNQEAADGHYTMSVRQTWEFVYPSKVQRTPRNKQNVNGDAVPYIPHASSIHKVYISRKTIKKL